MIWPMELAASLAFSSKPLVSKRKWSTFFHDVPWIYLLLLSKRYHGITPKKPPESLSHPYTVFQWKIMEIWPKLNPRKRRKSQELALDKDLQKLRESHDVIISPRVARWTPRNSRVRSLEYHGLQWQGNKPGLWWFMIFPRYIRETQWQFNSLTPSGSFSSGLGSNHQMVRSNQWPNLYNDVGVSLVKGMIDAFYGRIASSFSWIFFPLFLPWKPKETKGKQRKTEEIRGNQRKSKGTKGKMR